MSLSVVDHPFLRLGAACIALLVLPACGSATDGNMTSPISGDAVRGGGNDAASRHDVAKTSLTNSSNTEIVPGEVAGDEAPPERVHGRWRVIKETGTPRAKRMVGRILSFDDAALGWIGPDGKTEPGCRDPFYHIVSDASEARNFSRPFKPAWAKFELAQNRVGGLHVWECGDGDEIFGPSEPAAGSAFYPVGQDQLMMNWLDGNILLLRRAG